VQTEIDIIHSATGDFFISHIGFNKLNLIYYVGEITLFTGQEIIDDPDETAIGDEFAADIGTYKTGSTGYQKSLHRRSLSQIRDSCIMACHWRLDSQWS